MHLYCNSRLIPFVLFFLLACSTTFSSNPQILTLSDVLQRALHYSEEIHILKAQRDVSEQEINALKSAAWPQLTSSFQGIYSSVPVASSSPLGSEFDTTGSAKWKYKQYGWGLQLSQPLITFGRLNVLLKIARKNNQMAELNYELEKEKFLFQTLETYTQLLSFQSQAKTFAKSLSRLRTWEQVVSARKESGLQSSGDVFRMHARVQQALADSIQASFQSLVWKNRLKILLNYPQDTPIEIEPIPTNRPQASSYVTSLSNPKAPSAKRKDLELLELNKQSLNHWVKYERANLFPSISLVGNANSTIFQFQNQKSDFSPLIDSDAIQYSIGLQMNWTLFDGFATTSRTKQKKAEREIARRQWSQLKKNIELEQQESQQGLLFSQQVFQSTVWALQAAQSSHTQAKEEFENGLIGLDRLLEIETEWLKAQQDLTRAWIQRVLAQGRWRIAHGVSLQSFQNFSDFSTQQSHSSLPR